jgi:hypothetical protein
MIEYLVTDIANGRRFVRDHKYLAAAHTRPSGLKIESIPRGLPIFMSRSKISTPELGPLITPMLAPLSRCHHALISSGSRLPTVSRVQPRPSSRRCGMFVPCSSGMTTYPAHRSASTPR